MLPTASRTNTTNRHHDPNHHHPRHHQQPQQITDVELPRHVHTHSPAFRLPARIYSWCVPLLLLPITARCLPLPAVCCLNPRLPEPPPSYHSEYNTSAAKHRQRVGQLKVVISDLRESGFLSRDLDLIPGTSPPPSHPNASSAPIPNAAAPSGSTVVRLRMVRGVRAGGVEKEVWFIRHGESRWNEAKEDYNLMQMMAYIDHPLNNVGVAQSIQLNHRWRAGPAPNLDCSNRKPNGGRPSGADHEARGGNDHDVYDIRRAQRIYCSPLTRAVQTALLACHKHPAMAHGIVLLRHLREKKNSTRSLDTVGKATGPDIMQRAGVCHPTI